MTGFKYPKGSVWRKWDLQVQTILDDNYLSIEQYLDDIRDNTVDKYNELLDRIGSEDLVKKYDSKYYFFNDTSHREEQKVENYAKLFLNFIDIFNTNVGAVGVTDHNYDHPCLIDRLVDRSQSFDFNIIPGVEINVQGVHILVYFDKKPYNKQSYSEGIKIFLNKINVTNRKSNGILTVCDKSYTDVIDEIRDIGAVLIYSHCNSSNGLFQERGKTDRTHLANQFNYQKFNILQSQNKKSAEAVTSYVSSKTELKAGCVFTLGSDARSLNRMLSSDEEGNFCWIKADPTFEGLKQIIYEPELRVRIQEEDPRENEVYARIEKCTTNFPSSLKIKTKELDKKTDFCLRGRYEIEFSNNLTCVIGGRGIGKSTLIHLLYNTCEKKDISKFDNLNSPLLDLDLPPNSLNKVAELTTTEIPTDTEFFLQNEIEKFARDIDEMSKLISHRLLLLSSLNGQTPLKDLEREWREAFESMKELIEAYNIVSNINHEIESLKKQIETFKKQMAVIQSKEYKVFQKEIVDISDKISQFRRYKAEYNEIISKIDIVINAISQLDWSKEQGKSILDELSKLLTEYKDELKKSFSKIEAEFKTKDYFTELEKIKIQLRKYLESKGLKEENIEEIANASEQIKELEEKIRSLEKQRSPYKGILSEKESRLSKYRDKYNAYKNRFFTVTERLEKELEGLPFFDKEIKFTPKINEQYLKESVGEFVKDNNPSKISLRIDDIQTVLFSIDDITEYLTDKNKIRDYVNRCDKAVLHKQILQELVNDDIFLNKLYLLLWKEYYNISNIQVQTKLGDKLLQNTSFGERCGIVISIILIAGTNPIVIDQPEDNLDGKFISNVLVPLIRKRKLCRQIILVTRDANIVVGGDAELIHILEHDENDRKTIILPASIENTKYRDNYIWILDGGKEAFEKRERKYGFKL